MCALNTCVQCMKFYPQRPDSVTIWCGEGVDVGGFIFFFNIIKKNILATKLICFVLNNLHIANCFTCTDCLDNIDDKKMSL